MAVGFIQKKILERIIFNNLDNTDMKVINLIVREGKEGMRGMAHFGVGSLKKGFVEGRARG